MADLRGALPAPPSPQPKIFSISCSFSENLEKSYVGDPLEGWRPLLRGILDPPLYMFDEAEPEKLRYFRLSQNIKCVYFLNKQISSQIANNNS